MGIRTYKVYIGILLLFTLQSAIGQKLKTQDKKEIFDDAEMFFQDEDYKEASFNFLKLIEADPENGNISFRLGMCYINIPGEERKAIAYLEKAATKISVKYSESKVEETKAPLHALFYLGNAYRIDNQIDKALEAYDKFRNHKHFEGNYNERMVDEEIQRCERAKIIRDNPVNISRKNMGSVINNSLSNYKPITNKYENVLIFMSRLKFYDAIMMSRKVKGVWTEPENISPQIGSDGDVEPTCLTVDGNELYLVKKNKKNYDIYVSTWEGNRWSNMEALNKNVNTRGMETHASISADGKTLYFASDRRGGIGNLDIWKTTRANANDWGTAENLGKNINTNENENYPYITDDNKYLYFSSDGHLTMGGYDIFSSRFIPKKGWDRPINQGFPINSTGNDISFLPLNNGKIVYSSLILPEGLGKEDIYRIENHTVAAQDTSIGLSRKTYNVVIRDKVTKEIIGILQIDQHADSLSVKPSSNKLDIKIDE